MELAAQQTEAFNKIMEWFRGPSQVFTLAGYAGTGKTTLAKYIAASLPNTRVIFCAYTGKAAKVLRDKGCPNAGTIHSFVYSFLYQDEKTGKPVFGYDPSSMLTGSGLIVVDEYSMLSETIYQDLLATKNKVLFLGDPFQLPPIERDKIKIEPDFFLDEIHRQALESPVLRAANDVRTGVGLKYADNGDFLYTIGTNVPLQSYMDASQVIVGKNVTRRTFNDNLRGKHGFSGERFQAGEKIICLKNNKKNGLLNGMIGECKRFDEKGDYFLINFLCDGVLFQDIKVWKGDILGADPKSFNYKSGLDRFDYGYAITCHKSQGSEFEDVIIYNEPIGSSREEQDRWLYTALTRARTKAILVDPNG